MSSVSVAACSRGNGVTSRRAGMTTAGVAGSLLATTACAVSPEAHQPPAAKVNVTSAVAPGGTVPSRGCAWSQLAPASQSTTLWANRRLWGNVVRASPKSWAPLTSTRPPPAPLYATAGVAAPSCARIPAGSATRASPAWARPVSRTATPSVIACPGRM
jgi:hypothetical protein